MRLRQGEHAQATVYADDPVVAAKRFIDAGATRLTSWTSTRRGVSRAESVAAVTRMVAICVDAGCAVQVGGGIRDVETADTMAGCRVSLVIWEPGGARCGARPRSALRWRAGAARPRRSRRRGAGGGLDRGRVERRGAAPRLAHLARAGVVYTDTTRDGLLAGPDLDGVRTCRELYGGPAIASGGVGTSTTSRRAPRPAPPASWLGRHSTKVAINLADALEAFRE